MQFERWHIGEFQSARAADDLLRAGIHLAIRRVVGLVQSVARPSSGYHLHGESFLFY